MTISPTCQDFKQQAFNADGLLAMLPSYGDKRIKTLVIKVDDVFLAPGSLKWNLGKLAETHNIDLAKLKKRCASLLDLQYNISIAIAPGLVLLPVKVRQAKGPGETTFGYVAHSAIDEIIENNDCPGNASYKLKNGHILKTLHTTNTLILRMNQGSIVAKHIFVDGKPAAAACMTNGECNCNLVKLFNRFIEKS